jgi:hypothetical protein
MWQRPDDVPSSIRPRIFNVTDEIANGFNLIGVTVHDFHIGKLIFDQVPHDQASRPPDRH